MLHHVGFYRPRHRFAYARAWLQAYFFRYVPGKVLVVVQLIQLSKLLGIPASVTVVLTTWEILLLILGAATVAFVCIGSLTTDAAARSGDQNNFIF